MSKRFSSNQHYGENKKARLNISMSEHHLPLSQNSNKENDFDNWGDDNDDEILLQASQACEQAISCDTSTLPNYSMWEPPGSTSTQYQPAPSTSKAAFTFKKPSGNPPSAISTHLKNKCSTIASPLPGMANKFIPDTNGYANLTDDLVINAKAIPGQDNYAYNEIVRLKEEKEKLMADIDKLQQKCVTKDGEASILRTQLKSCQMAVDSVRMEKARAQEEVEMKFKKKLDAFESQLANLQTQLDFKNLEIISVKEKCKNLESGKRMTQVIVPGHDVSSSYRNNLTGPSDSIQIRRALTTSSGIQTEDNAPFVRLKKTRRKDVSKISEILPLILEPTQQHHSILDYNENLQKQSDFSQIRSIVISTSNRTRSGGGKMPVSVVEDVVNLLEAGELQSKEKCFHLFDMLHTALGEVLRELEEISRRVSTAFLKEMDERYIEASAQYQDFDRLQLLKGEQLYPAEQAVSCRRLLGAAACVLQAAARDGLARHDHTLPDVALRICDLIERCSCGTYYSGWLTALCAVLEALVRCAECGPRVARCARAVAACRAAPGALLRLRRALHALHDHDQGVQLYRRESCHMQVLLKQVEAELACILRLRIHTRARDTAAHLAQLHASLAHQYAARRDHRCECQAMLVQCLVYSLRVCTLMLDNDSRNHSIPDGDRTKMVSVCWTGVATLVRSSLHAADFASTLAPCEGHLSDTCDALRRLQPDPDQENMLNELTSTFQVATDEEPASYLQEPWLTSFQNFAVTN